MKSLQSFKKNYILHFHWTYSIEDKQRSLSCSPSLFQKKLSHIDFERFCCIKSRKSQNSQENTYAKSSFLIKLQASRTYFFIEYLPWLLLTSLENAQPECLIRSRFARAWNSIFIIFSLDFLSTFCIQPKVWNPLVKEPYLLKQQKSRYENVYLLKMKLIA